MKFAVQLYNFREELATDFKGTLKRIADMGFDGVEFACNYGGIPPQELADFLQSIHLECAGTMFEPSELTDPENAAWDYAAKLHSPAVTISYHADFAAEYDAIRNLFSTISQNAADKGIPFTYHNHWWEFGDVDGMTALERLICLNIPNFYLETDISWLTAAGFNPADFIRKYADKVKQVHFKDLLDPSDKSTFTELGKGAVRLQESFETVRQLGLEYIIYEQDVCKDPFVSAAQSLEFLKNL